MNGALTFDDYEKLIEDKQITSIHFNKAGSTCKYGSDIKQ